MRSDKVLAAADNFYNNVKDVIAFPLRYEQSTRNTVELFDDNGLFVFQIYRNDKVASTEHLIAKEFCELVNAIAKEQK